MLDVLFYVVYFHVSLSVFSIFILSCLVFVMILNNASVLFYPFSSLLWSVLRQTESDNAHSGIANKDVY